VPVDPGVWLALSAIVAAAVSVVARELARAALAHSTSRRARELWLVMIVTLAMGGLPWGAPQAGAASVVEAVGPIGMTVANMDRSVAFYSGVLGFEKVSDVEVWGPDYERLQNLFGLHLRVVRMRLGGESIELTEYLTPQGRPVPADFRGSGVRVAAPASRPARLTSAPAAAGLERERRRDPRVLLQRSRWPLPRDPLVPPGQGRSALAPADRPAVSRH